MLDRQSCVCKRDELQLKATIMSSMRLEDDGTPELVESGERHASN